MSSAADPQAELPTGRTQLVEAFTAAAAHTPASSWLALLADVCDLYRLSLAEQRSIATHLAWTARSAGRPIDGDAPRADSLLSAYWTGQRLRFDFRFESLGARCENWLAEYPDDALIIAFAAFAHLGRGDIDGLQLVEQSLTSADADFRSRHVCLHALWTAHHLAGTAERTLQVAGSMVESGVTDPNLHFRMASAHRALGNYGSADECMTQAFELLEPGAVEVHQDYVRERELIALARVADLGRQA